MGRCCEWSVKNGVSRYDHEYYSCLTKYLCYFYTKDVELFASISIMKGNRFTRREFFKDFLKGNSQKGLRDIWRSPVGRVVDENLVDLASLLSPVRASATANRLNPQPVASKKTSTKTSTKASAKRIAKSAIKTNVRRRRSVKPQTSTGAAQSSAPPKLRRSLKPPAETIQR